MSCRCKLAKKYQKFTEVTLIVHSLLRDADPTTAAIFAYVVTKSSVMGARFV